MTKPKPKTFAEWQDIRRSNPRQYYRSQRQVVQDIEALGQDRFYGRTPVKSEDQELNEIIRRHLEQSQ